MKKIIINKPRITEDKNSCLLKSVIELPDNTKYDMWFKVEKEYKDYLCTEKSDAFLVALIPYFVKHNYNVEVKGNISSKLYYQLTSYLLPLLVKTFHKNKITIETGLTDEVFGGKGVGASISCGVDSFYTLLKHKNCKDPAYNITHLTFFNAGSCGEYGGEEARKLYYQRLERIKKFCEEYNYKLITVDTNMNELIMMNHEKTHTFRTLACVLALERLFSKYYFASGLGFDGSHIDEEDTAYYDILNMSCLTTENITFYISGIEVSRSEKVQYISDFEETYKYLNVCVLTDENCGICEKCIRTMTALEAIGRLEKYNAVFDLEKYKKNKYKIFARIYRYRRDKIKKEFYEDIFKLYKSNNIKYPKLPFLISLIPNKETIKSFLPDEWIYKLKKNKKRDGWV